MPVNVTFHTRYIEHKLRDKLLEFLSLPNRVSHAAGCPMVRKAGLYRNRTSLGNMAPCCAHGRVLVCLMAGKCNHPLCSMWGVWVQYLN